MDLLLQVLLAERWLGVKERCIITTVSSQWHHFELENDEQQSLIIFHERKLSRRRQKKRLSAKQMLASIYCPNCIRALAQENVPRLLASIDARCGQCAHCFRIEVDEGSIAVYAHSIQRHKIGIVAEEKDWPDSPPSSARNI